jgi:hypothetical protein
MPSRTKYTALFVLVTLGTAWADDVKKNLEPAKEARYLGKSTSYWVKKLEHEDAKVRKHAISVLGMIGPEAAKAVPALVKALEDDDADVCYGVLEALGQIGPGAKAAIPALLEAVEDKDTRYRIYALKALGNTGVGDGAVVSALTHKLLDEDTIASNETVGDAALAASVKSVPAQSWLPFPPFCKC